jgi:hypothetical protein
LNDEVTVLREENDLSRYPEIEIQKVRTYSIGQRKSKVAIDDFATTFNAGDSFASFINSLPNILKGTDIKRLVEYIAFANKKGKPILLMMGAHVIKCGLNPIIIDLMERGIVTGLALNGAGAIHDSELAYWGTTSEDVVEGLADGSFGMARETGEILNDTIAKAKDSQTGFGEALGKRIHSEKPKFTEYSLLANGYELGVPVTVHVGIGTDIVHQQPNADGAAIGELSLRDFRIFTHQVSQLGDGGVVLNLGSAVILPEVFLKAITVARNLGHPVHNFTTANFDMLPHYRPRVNVVERPVKNGGQGFQFIGHHEIMIPLLAAAIKETCG